LIELLPFQLEASTKIADRFQSYMRDPLMVTRTKNVPFYQNLSAITGSGKTVMLADTIEQIRTRLPLEPIVLWLSKGKVVVMQTLTNLSTGKYAELIGGYEVKPLLDCTPIDVEDSARGLLLVATVGKFNQRDKEEGDRKIFRVGLDAADESLWNMLAKRRDQGGRRRPLIVVYDEGHNLSNQQTALLAELDPDALLAASATIRVPEALTKTIDRLREDKNWLDEDFLVSVKSSDVVAAGLVKKHILLGGYLAPMEICLNEMLADFKAAGHAARELRLSFQPKAIYVSTTNAVDGATPREDALRPFKQRRARPILIWRHLVEKCHVDPASIAVYCDLRIEKRAPAPPEFNLFSGGDADYDRFMLGGYTHIIFNLSLQEGWDDPSCYFAYIDKEMGSPDQVTQIVGRVLRQPNAQHYSANIMNTAHFFVRTDEKGVFEEIIDDVRRRISAEVPDITLTVRSASSRHAKLSLDPRKERHVPSVSIDSSEAQAPIQNAVRSIMNFSGDGENTVGPGSRIQVLQTIGREGDTTEEWVDVAHSNLVTARWVFAREVQKRRPKALHLCDIEDPKFDVMVEYNSRAVQHLREKAGVVVDAYLEHSIIVQNPLDHPNPIGPVPVHEAKVERYRHALHEGYSDLNELERVFARAIDRTKKVWCRNPTVGGFTIDLLDSGRTRQFKPDFLVWSGKHVVAIDTKGDHLIVEDAARKLFYIPQVEEGPRLVIRLVTDGEWHVKAGVPEKRPGTAEFTVWRWKQGKLHAKACANAADTVKECLIVHQEG
jgi:type III restriction enzyme